MDEYKSVCTREYRSLFKQGCFRYLTSCLKAGLELDYRFDRPSYSIVLYFPFALINDFDLARVVWMLVSEIAILLSAFLSIKLAGWKPSILEWGLVVVFSMGWFHGISPIINGSVMPLIGLCLVFAIYAVQQKQDELAGIVLGLTLINPETTIVFIVFILIWALSNRRGRIVFWLFATFFLLFLLSYFINPDWIMSLLRAVLGSGDSRFLLPATPAEALAVLFPGGGSRVGLLISAICGLLIFTEVFLGRFSKGRDFFWASCFVIVLSQWVMLPSSPTNYIIMLPALILGVKLIGDRWRRFGFWMNLGIFILLFVIPWATVFFRNQGSSLVELTAALFFPVPFILVVLLYWVRWWAKNPIKDAFSQ